jgi:hypothetical protein
MGMLRHITLQGLRRGETIESIRKQIGEMLPALNNKKESAAYLWEMILGFSNYYARKGLL